MTLVSLLVNVNKVSVCCENIEMQSSVNEGVEGALLTSVLCQPNSSLTFSLTMIWTHLKESSGLLKKHLRSWLVCSNGGHSFQRWLSASSWSENAGLFGQVRSSSKFWTWIYLKWVTTHLAVLSLKCLFPNLDVLMELFISHLKLKCGNFLGLGQRDTFYQ